VDAAVPELFAEQRTDAGGGALEAVGAGSVRDVVQAHSKHSHLGGPLR